MEWYECEEIEEIDEYIKDNFSNDRFNEYLRTFNEGQEDWQKEIENWIEDQKSILDTVLDLVDEFYNSSTSTIKGDEDD